ncbi:hypothetical protein Hanom_Chr02g00106431 [Helianthus anomalus]
MYFWQRLGTKCVTKCKPQGPSVYFWKAKDQIQNFGQPQGPSVYFTQKNSVQSTLPVLEKFLIVAT